jgi:hypothetical protein
MIKSTEELKEILRLHALWANDRNTGKQANLSEANLTRADLTRANLSGATLSGATLTRADLSGANLDFEVVTFGPFGTIKQQTTYVPSWDKVWSGCWVGNFEEFKKRVEQQFPDPTSITRRKFEAAILLCEVVKE